MKREFIIELREKGEKTIKLKDHQVELFEKCKYTGTERTPKNKENDCSVMDIEGETNLAEQYKKEIEFLKKTIERQASQIIDLQRNWMNKLPTAMRNQLRIQRKSERSPM